MDRVKQLHKDLKKSDKNYKRIIEELSEYFLYGDHQSEEIFDYFAEHNILLMFFERIKKADVHLAIFIIERMSMIITNLQNPLNLNYVLSNPVLHDFINYTYDFDHNPELVDYYVNFLKTIAIRINRENFYLYFNQRYSSFPLLWQAQKFINYPDNLVRNTIQNIILSLAKLASEPEIHNKTQSVIYNQNKIMKQFKLYLTCSHFIRTYEKYIKQMKFIIIQLKTRDQVEQLNDLLLFFNDLFTECPFLFNILEILFQNLLILPILDCLLLGKNQEINIRFELALYSIYILLTKLPLVYTIMKYFQEQFIYIENNCKNLEQSPKNWYYDNKNYDKDFQMIFQNDPDDLNEYNNQIFKSHNMMQNPFQEQFIYLLRSKDNTLLYLQLAIWLEAKKHNYSIPVDQIIQLLTFKGDIMYSINVIDIIILLIYDEQSKELDQIYNVYTKQINDILDGIINHDKKIHECLQINLPLITDFSFEIFKKQSITISLEDTNCVNEEPKLSMFKQFYIWTLLQFGVYKKNKPIIIHPKINDFINHLDREDEFIKITNTEDEYLIIDKLHGNLIHSISSQLPNQGIVKFIQPLRAIESSFQDDMLILECSKQYQRPFRSYKLRFSEETIKIVISRIYEAQKFLHDQTILQLQSLFK